MKVFFEKYGTWILAFLVAYLVISPKINLNYSVNQKSKTTIVVTENQAGDISCIAHAVYHEARGEQTEGQLAVAYVVINRLGDGYSGDVCKVVYQDKQFSHIRRTMVDFSSKQWAKAVAIATKAYYGIVPDPTKGAKFFYAPNKVKQPKWAKQMVASQDIGNHRFFNLRSK